MRSPPPVVLHALLTAHTAEEREQAWEGFLGEFSRLLLHAARAFGLGHGERGEHDLAMDRYAFVLDALRRDDFRRLRGYHADRGGKFSTWLFVVVRRLCLDEHRHRYGRPQSDGAASVARQLERRNLTDLVGAELASTEPETPGESPDERLRGRELRGALEAALATLDPSDRLLLRFRFEDGLSVPEIARLTNGGSAFPLYRRLDKVFAKLRKSLQAVGVDSAVP